ncbi:hypothetical protein BFW01_g5328 [Lasiodiplodia theobromae]|nr:hypothetical protein BFW01_g5328 [Lasiodiplodia theobromae]
MFQSTHNRPYHNGLLSLFLLCHSFTALASPPSRASVPVYSPSPPVYSANFLELGTNKPSPPVAAAEALPTTQGPMPVMLPTNGAATGAFVPSAPFPEEPATMEESALSNLREVVSPTASEQQDQAWGATRTEGVNSFIRQQPTYTPEVDGGQECPVTECKDYMNMSCFSRYGGCWDMCAENRKYLPPDCAAPTAHAANVIVSKPTVAPTTSAVPTTA